MITIGRTDDRKVPQGIRIAPGKYGMAFPNGMASSTSATKATGAPSALKLPSFERRPSSLSARPPSPKRSAWAGRKRSGAGSSGTRDQPASQDA